MTRFTVARYTKEEAAARVFRTWLYVAGFLYAAITGLLPALVDGADLAEARTDFYRWDSFYAVSPKPGYYAPDHPPQLHRQTACSDMHAYI